MLKTNLMTLMLLTVPAIYAQKVVENELAPKSAAQTLLFEEDLRFGADEDEDVYVWTGSNCSVQADEKGNIYVSDAGDKRILQFDDKGVFIKVFARSGEGPGEIRGIPALRIFADGSGLGYDMVPNSMPRLNYYGPHLTYRDVKTPIDGAAPFFPIISPKGTMMGGGYSDFDPEAGMLYIKSGVIDMDLKVVKELTSHGRTLPTREEAGTSKYWSFFIGRNLKQAHSGSGRVTFDQQGNVYTAVNTKYEITRWSPDMSEKQLVIRKKYKPIPFTEKDIKGMVENMTESMKQNPDIGPLITEAVVAKGIELAEMSTVKNPLISMLTTEDNLLLVITEIQLATGMQKADIFSPAGAFLGTTTIGEHAFFDYASESPRMSFRNGFAYTTVISEQGDVRVVRYKTRLAPMRHQDEGTSSRDGR